MTNSWELPIKAGQKVTSNKQKVTSNEQKVTSNEQNVQALQRFILGPIFFSDFINDLFFFIKEAELANFSNDNAIYVGSKDLTELLEILQKEPESAINLFKTNTMIVNPEKFQSVIISSKSRTYTNTIS